MALNADLLSAIQRILLETTIDSGVTWSSLWTATEVYNYLNQRVSRFRLESEHHLTRTTIAVTTPNATANLPSDLIALRQVAWLENGATRVLTPIDAHAVDNTLVPSDLGTPYGYTLEPEDPLLIRLTPAPSVNGTLVVLYVAEHTTLTVITPDLPLLDFFEPYILCGVLADMFGKEGEANDPERATYFSERWDEGIELAKLVTR